MYYLACLVQENPFIDPDYIEGLKTTKDKVKRERLLKGNWEYDDNPNALCSHDAICEIFGNKISIKTGTNLLQVILHASELTMPVLPFGTVGIS